MLLEIIWLTFAIAWGTIKVWTTRAVSIYNFDGKKFTLKQDMLEENSWSFGQTLPLVLILLPLLSMAQAYLDNDAKAQEALEHAHNLRESVSKEKHDSECATDSSGQHARNELPGPRTSTSCSITRCNHHPYPHVARAQSDTTSPPPSTSFHLPQYPYDSFTQYPWYNDRIVLLCQALQLTGFSLFVLAELANILGISAILRNRFFLLWVFAMIPLASLIHLAAWYVAASIVVRWTGCEEWLTGINGERGGRWWRRVTVGQCVYWSARMGLVAGCLVGTLFVSLEAAEPDPLSDSL
jgi:hypothetical protein